MSRWLLAANVLSYRRGRAGILRCSCSKWRGPAANSNGYKTSTDNPAQVLVTSAKSVKAVFVKNEYSYNLKIVGPGVVDEYLVQDTKASLEYGTQVLLKALPAEGAVFKGGSCCVVEVKNTAIFAASSHFVV